MRHEVQVTTWTRLFYPWAEMAVGDDFIIPTEDPKMMREKIAVSGYNYRKRHGSRFKTKTIRINGGFAVLTTRIE